MQERTSTSPAPDLGEDADALLELVALGPDVAVLHLRLVQRDPAHAREAEKDFLT